MGERHVSTKELDELRIPVIQEEVELGVRTRETGSVRVRTMVDEERLTLTKELTESRVAIDRVPMNRRVDRAPEERVEGATRILPVLEERLVVIKELWLVEELHIRRETVTEEVTIPVDRRMTRVEIDRTDQQQEN